MADGFVHVEGGRLWYERAGEGFPVVLIHPGLWDSRIWDDQFEEFSAHHDIVRYDLRGSGRSDVPDHPYSDLRDLRFLLGELGIDRCALVGCATGAQLALDFALLHGSLVDAIVMVSPGISGYTWNDAGLEILIDEVTDAVRAGELERAMEVELAVWAPLTIRQVPRAREIAMDNRHVLRSNGTLLELASPAVTRLGDVEAASLVIVGDHDVEEIHQIADLLVEAIPGASKRVIANADQLVNVARPDRFNRMVLDFLSFRT